MLAISSDEGVALYGDVQLKRRESLLNVSHLSKTSLTPNQSRPCGIGIVRLLTQDDIELELVSIAENHYGMKSSSLEAAYADRGIILNVFYGQAIELHEYVTASNCCFICRASGNDITHS